MNKIQTLIKCRNLWSYMAITGSVNRNDYKFTRRWAFQCPCCMKAGATLTSLGENDDGIDCTKCVLNGYAWKRSISRNAISCCRDVDSYFRLWKNSGTSRVFRIYWSERMVQACNRAIEDLIVHGRLRP